MQTIGVTGGTGFIGRYLLRDYQDQFQFVVVTSGASGREPVEGPSIRYVTGEYTEETFLRAFAGCDGIVHLGAKRSAADSEQAFFQYQENLAVSEAVFRAARQLGISNVVNLSSRAVYDRDLPVPYSEEMAVSPLSFYGVSKRTVELIAAMYNKRWGMHIKSLRLAQVMGEGERPGYILTVFKERCRDGLPLSVYGQGKSGKEYVYVKDVVRAIVLALGQKEKQGVYNIGSGVFTSNRELAETFVSVFKNPAGFQLLTDKPEEVYDCRMDVHLAEQELGFRCVYDLRAAVEDTKLEMESQGNG